MNDGELIGAVQRGDRTALTTLYQRYLGSVWRYLHAHLSRDIATTEDLTSETFLHAIRTIQACDPQKGTVYGWLLGIARNKLHDHFRRTTRGASCARCRADAAPDSMAGDPESGLVQAETRNAVIQALDALDDDERLLLEWKYIESFSVREMAQRLGKTEKAVEAILYRARISFRQAYARRQRQSEP